MAEDIGSLYMRLGLNLSELETGFIAANRSVNENIRRLNRASDLIRIRSEVEITGLDEVADAERILQIRTNALNQQMEIQRDRVRILTAELQNLTQAHGEDSVATQRAAIRLERERLALVQLERELRNLNGAQGETDESIGEFSSLLSKMPPQLQAVAKGVGAIVTGLGAAGVAVKDLREEFRELQTQSYELNLPVNDTKQLLRELKLAGGDIGDIEGYIRGITDAYVKGEYDDPEFIALRRYGSEITDAEGRLKNFAEILEEVFKAWAKAEAEGSGIEFLQLTGGESGIRDAIQLFKRLKEAREDTAKIYDASLDSEQLHELDRAFALVEEQSKELKNALGDIFTPAAQASAEKFFKALHDGTEYLVENRDAIQKWGFVAAEVFSTIADKISKGYSAVGEFIEEAMNSKNTTGNERVDKMLSGMAWRYDSAQIPYGVDKMVSGMTEATKNYGVFNEAVARAEKKQQEFNGNLHTSIKSWADFRREVEETESTLKEGDGDPLSQYGWQRAQQFRAELDELRAELDNWGNDYETALAQLNLWRDQELTQKNYVSMDEREAIGKLYSAKLEQIERERADRIEKIRKSVDAEFKNSLENRIAKIEEEKETWISAGMEEAEAAELTQKRIANAYEEVAEKAKEYFKNATDIEYSLTHTGFEKQLRDIELWKEAQQQKAETAEEVAGIIKDAAMREAEAFENAVERIRGKIQSLDDKIFAQEHSRYEQEVRRIQQERIRYYEEFQKEGMLTADVKAKIERWYGKAIRNLNRQAAESREKNGEYTKSPEGSTQRGGNGIIVIGGDEILDDGLKNLQTNIGLLADENQIRAQLSPKLSENGRAMAAEIEARKNLTSAQRFLEEKPEFAEGFQLIEGDKVVSSSLNEFSDAVQETQGKIEQMNQFAETQETLNDTLAQLANNLPIDYFKNLADGFENVSTMQLSLTESTMKLIDAQSRLNEVLENLSDISLSGKEKENFPEVFQRLSVSTKELVNAQDIVFHKTREVEDETRYSGQGINVAFDYDTAKDIFLTGVGLAAATGSTGIGLAFSPEILAAALVSAGVGGFAKGTYDETMSAREQELSNFADIGSSVVITPLTSIDGTLQSLLSEIQGWRSEPVAVSFETIVTPLNNIGSLVTNILTALENREPAKMEVSPNLNIDLGGAYVFDEAMKASLVNDITDRVVSEITSAVQQATNRTNYGYSA